MAKQVPEAKITQIINAFYTFFKQNINLMGKSKIVISAVPIIKIILTIFF